MTVKTSHCRTNPTPGETTPGETTPDETTPGQTAPGHPKRDLRRRLRQVMDDMTLAQMHHRSIEACARLIQTRVYQRAETVMVFLSLPNEVDTTTLVHQIWRDRKRVLVPKVSWEQRRMLPIEIQSLTENISTSPMGLREPVEGIPIPLADIDLVIVPGLGFDQAGNRIGRGGGFYDRFLTHDGWHGTACALALEDQVVEEVPVNEQDVKIDMLVTNTAVRTFHH